MDIKMLLTCQKNCICLSWMFTFEYMSSI